LEGSRQRAREHIDRLFAENPAVADWASRIRARRRDLDQGRRGLAAPGPCPAPGRDARPWRPSRFQSRFPGSGRATGAAPWRSTCCSRGCAAVCLLGKAGTGKTLLALAAFDADGGEENYRAAPVARRSIPWGATWVTCPVTWTRSSVLDQPIYDNLEHLLGEFDLPGRPDGHPIEQLVDQGLLEVEALDLHSRPFLAEAIHDRRRGAKSHAPRHQTVVTRAGEGTKIVLTGRSGSNRQPLRGLGSNRLSYAALRLRGDLWPAPCSGAGRAGRRWPKCGRPAVSTTLQHHYGPGLEC